MTTIIASLGNDIHKFTAPTEFLDFEEWVKQVKGDAVYAEWQRLDQLADKDNPEFCELYEEWIIAYDITHEVTQNT